MAEIRRPLITKPKISPETSNEPAPKSSGTSPVQSKRERRSHAMPSITLYRPPAARRLEDQTSSNQEREPINNSINGKHDCKCPSELADSGQTPKKIDSSGISMFRNAISSIRTQNQLPKSKPVDPVKKTESTDNAPPVRPRRPDMKVYVPKARRMLIDQQNSSKEDSAVQSEVNSVNSNEKPKKRPVESDFNDIKNSEVQKKTVQNELHSAKNSEVQKKPVQNELHSPKNSEVQKKFVQNELHSPKNSEVQKKFVQNELHSPKNSEVQKKPVQNELHSPKNSEIQKKPVQNELYSPKNSEIQKKRVKNDFHSAKRSEEPKKTREHSENLESDKKQCESSFVCLKNTGYSDSRTVKFEPKTLYPVSATSLWIEAQNEVEVKVKKDSSLVSNEISGNNSSDANVPRSSLDKTCGNKAIKKNSQQLNPEECDWESMFDDSGECLDPSLLEQLSSAVGAVTIEKPKSNYDTFRTKTLDLVGDEFPHVIEIYNFPPEFCHQDLVIAFSQFKNAGFEIKWVDDTHALGIFGSAQIVSEVLALRHPFVKTRMLKDGTTLSKAKARRFSEHLLPYKTRPNTCTALARRLVTGALGVRLPTSREEREAERKILSEARERKRKEAREREDAWEGTFH